MEEYLKIKMDDGVYDLQKGMYLPPAANADAPTTLWKTFLREIFPEKGADGHWKTGGGRKADLLQEFMGYCLMDTCRYQRALMLCGTGFGKSTVVRIMEMVVRIRKSVQMGMSELGNAFNLPRLKDKRLLSIPEPLVTKSTDAVQAIKKIIDGDPLDGQIKMVGPERIWPIAKIVIESNTAPPLIQSRSYRGMAGKILVLHFDQTFHGKIDPMKVANLADEIEGIRYFALLGARRLMQRGSFVE